MKTVYMKLLGLLFILAFTAGISEAQVVKVKTKEYKKAVIQKEQRI
ncbi:MAG: hypothetical protein HC906_12055 [Bacteroidales bacterium]|nr:hypothetical protein [Bacteroidales bacterium]